MEPTSILDRVGRALPRSLAERLALTRRDVKMVLDGLAGRAPSPLLRRRAFTASAHAAIAGRAVRVREVVRETDEAVSLVLVDPTGAPIEYLPGQFFTVCVTLDGVTHRRAYSASRAPGDPALRLTVKRVAQGLVSTHLTTRVGAGDTLELLGPSGSFTWAPGDGAPRHLVLLGGGSGITPLFAILEAALTREPGARVTLVYGNRSRESVIFGDTLDALAAAHPGRLTVIHALEDPPEGFAGIAGRLDDAALGAALATLDAGDLYYICGPTPMREAARRALTRQGVETARVFEEVYSSPHSPAAAASAAPQVVRLRVGGRDAAVTVKAGETILDAATRAGVPLPFSCAVGGCGSCQCKRVSGEVVMEEPNCLTAAERDAGAVLTCVGRPAGPGVVLEVP